MFDHLTRLKEVVTTKLAAIRYGDARRKWSPEFIEYMDRIVDHPNYAGLPCTRDDEGKIDWIIPSNRPRGSKNWDGNRRRRDWWAAKARSEGIALEGEWLSKTAKHIHPFGKKPCQTCGRTMEIGYVYPTRATVRQLNRHLPVSDQLIYESCLSIDDVIDHLFLVLQAKAGAVLRASFHDLSDPQVNSAAAAKVAVRELYCSRESSKFSPGAMANPPDRLDGFHTYNLCCRAKQDTGRSIVNLKTYGVDRRAYEQWCEGDWAVADLLMTQVAPGICSNCGNTGPLTADHIGPISIGFAHSPDMRPLCRSCNSAKNNRMTLADVTHLIRREHDGHQVVSWQARVLWDACKGRVTTDHEALLLSKLLRINQHHYLLALNAALATTVPDAIQQFLQPQHALFRITFVNLDPSRLTYSEVIRQPRQDTYAQMRASRMIRVAYDALVTYAAKRKRNIQTVDDALVEADLRQYQDELDAISRVPSAYRTEFAEILSSDLGPAIRDERLTDLRAVDRAPAYPRVRERLETLMASYGRILRDRYVRGEAVSWDDLEE